MSLFVNPYDPADQILIGTDDTVSNTTSQNITPLQRPQDGTYLTGPISDFGVPMPQIDGSRWRVATGTVPRPDTVQLLLEVRARSGGATPQLFAAVNMGTPPTFTGTVGFLDFTPVADRGWVTFGAAIPGWETLMDPAAFLTKNVWIELAITAATVDVGFAGLFFPYTSLVLPALRQFPRDDALGGQPRQFGSKSVQASARVGWKGSYR